jgi:uncharacterized protein (TIGR02246 family)
MNGTESLMDRLRIRDTAERYFFCADSHDAEGVARCFARDGVFRSVTQTDMMLRGREQIVEGFRSFAGWGRSCHLISSMDIALDGPAAAAKLFGVSYVAGQAQPGDPIRVRGLTYTDRWIVEDGQWLIVERVHEALWQFEETLIHTQLPSRT